MSAAAGELLTLEGVGKVFGRHRALVDLSITYRPGQVAVVLGPNGAGKSTLLAILSTLLGPSTGRMLYDGQPVARAGPVRTRIGYVGHEPGLYGDLTARQNLELFAGLYGIPDPAGRATALLGRVGLGEVRPDATVRTFSRGMQQRLSLARALVHTPPILLFDEPGSALDPAGAAWLGAQIAEERAAGRLIVLVTHDLEAAAAVADQLIILRRGRLAFAETRLGGFSPAEVRSLYDVHTRGRAAA